jgi:glycosyltransferase involved in cell wall biosynthesis
MRAFRAAGHEVELLCREGQPLQARAWEEGFIAHGRRNALGQIAFLAARGRGYGILHAQTANTVTWAVLTKPLHGRPVAFTRRTAFAAAPGEQWKTGFKWRRVDAFAAISEMAAGEPRRLGLSPAIIRSAVEPRELDLARGQTLLRELGLANAGGARKKVLATTAALIGDKDPLTLTRAVAELARERRDFAFVHFGAEGDQAGAARAEARALGLDGIFFFAGFRPAVEDYFSIMDVFVMTSREEALGSSVLDAFLYRVPVVSTDAGGLKESLADGRGVLCPAGDAPALARGMARCLDDAEFCAAATQRAYDYVRREHGVTEMGRRYLALFDQALKRRHG